MAQGAASRPKLVAPLLIAPILLASAFPAFSQGDPAKAAAARLVPLAGSPGLAKAASDEAAALASLSDAAWLLGEAAKAASDPRQRKALLAERAALLELLGRLPEAAAAWEDSARAVAGGADARSLLAAAACRLASGEVDAASGLVTAAGFAAPDPASARLASVLEAWIALARGDTAGALARAEALLREPGLAPRGAEAIASLGLAVAASEGAAKEAYAKRLAATRQGAVLGPVALLLADQGPVAALARSPTEETKPVDTTSVVTKPVETPRTVAPEAQATLAYFQLGVFRDEANAKALAARIGALGLEPRLSRKESTGHYVVYIEGGADPARTVLVLKDAGFEAWALDRRP